MAYGVDARRDGATPLQRHSVKAGPRALFGGLTLAVIALGCALALYRSLDAPAPPTVETTEVARVLPAEPLFDPALLHATYPMGAVVMFSRTDLPFGPVPRTIRRAAAPPAQDAPPVVRAVQSVPLPTPRPAALALAHVDKPALQATAQRSRPKPDDPFQKLFGRPQDAPALAYAPSDGGIFNNGRSLNSARLPPNDGLTAIYDITARTVYLPDGTRLEAHSGLGPMMDDPRHVHVKMHGATPPHVYDLTPREALFHGVQALRLIPVGGEGAIFGRTGLLTHSYLLGPRGDSNGCISFKDYDAFLRAYQNGKFKRMVVVASLDQFDGVTPRNVAAIRD
jgi:hypothetical protein